MCKLKNKFIIMDLPYEKLVAYQDLKEQMSSNALNASQNIGGQMGANPLNMNPNLG
jgi:hypothetical protein